MGLFGKLFEKKECAICGNDIGVLGNRKLEDGNMCKHCAAKLSPWFSDRRHSTVAEINEQLAYRARNAQSLKNFHPTRRIGENYKMIVEERGGVPYRFLVTAASDYTEENSDLILFTDVSSCNIHVDESRSEVMSRNDKGEAVSYNPPRYRYSYHFNVNLTVENNPYFSEIAFKLNGFSVDITPDSLGRMPGQTFGQLLFGGNSFDPNTHPEYSKFMRMCYDIEALVEAGRNAGIAESCAPIQDDAQSQAAFAPRFCPECGTPASGGKFCENCGSPLQASAPRRRRNPQ